MASGNLTEGGRSFELQLTVEPQHIDRLGHVNNVTYLQWVQDVAVAHWQTLATPEEQARLLWVVLRHEIDYKRPALCGDRVLLRTWVGDASRLKFERHTEIQNADNGKLLAKARTLWCPIDAEKRVPVNAGPELRAKFSI